jgi:hypothetical protein
VGSMNWQRQKRHHPWIHIRVLNGPQMPPSASPRGVDSSERLAGVVLLRI